MFAAVRERFLCPLALGDVGRDGHGSTFIGGPSMELDHAAAGKRLLDPQGQAMP